jgi:hypothetical protein
MRLNDHLSSYWRLVACLGTAVASMVVAAGCSANSPTPTSMPPASTSTHQQSSPQSPPSPADAAKQSAVAAYRSMWQNFVAAGATSDWQAVSLGQYATDPALTNMRRSLLADHNDGLVTKGEPTFAPAVSAMEPAADPNKITITDCADSTHWLKYKANGQLKNDTPGGRSLINAIVVKQPDGSWKVSEYGVHGVSTC